MEPEQLQNFNERLSQWVSNQGLWFQVRYSMSGSGLKGRAMFHLLRIVFRLSIFLLIAAVIGWIFLVKRADSVRFNKSLRTDLQTAMSATKLEIPEGGVNRVQSQLEISRLAAEGGDETFFTSMEAKNIRCKMGLVDGLVGVWKPGIISVARLDLDLRAGSDDAQAAKNFSDVLFRKSGKFEARTFEIDDATIRWGYSERTQGSIESSALRMVRTESGWRMHFKGGWFSQNWLNKFEIVNLVVASDTGGLVVEKADLKQKDGTLDFSGLRLTGGERPQVEGVAKIRNVALEGILPPAMRTFVEGTISGDFRVFGSTNTSDGIGFEGQVVLDGKSSVSIRERIHLLKALSDMDYSRNYHRVDFREGSFMMKTLRGGIELSEVKLKAEDLFTLEGKMSVRLPTQEEIQESVAKGSGAGNSPLFASEDEVAQSEEIQREADFSLRKAGQAAKRVKDGLQSADSFSLFDRLSLGIQMRQLQGQAAERMSRMLRYEGMFRITIPGDAFERANRLQILYPVDPATGRISIKVPLEGHLYELTLKQAEDIYERGKR